MKEIIDLLKKYTDGKKNIEKVEVSVLNLNRIIKALEKTDVTDINVGDIISREETIKSIENMKRFQQDTDDICEMIQNLPPVTPQPEKHTEERTKTLACDCISRQAAIEWLKDKDIIKTKNQEENARRELAELPSVEPEVNKQKAISELQPPTDNWEAYADRLYDLAYLSGYNDGLIAKGNQDHV